MARISSVSFLGKSGNKYVFNVYPIGQAFKNLGAVYAVTRRYPNGNTFSHDIIYIGETGDLSTRFDDHHKADCFTIHNSNCVCTHSENDEDLRLAVEDDLVKLHKPLCND